MILNHLICQLDQEELVPESQCGFRKDHGTTDMIFAARQLQEKCQEQNLGLYLTFVDLTKAFDSVSVSREHRHRGEISDYLHRPV